MVLQDDAAAARLFKLAADQGDLPALDLLDRLTAQHLAGARVRIAGLTAAAQLNGRLGTAVTPTVPIAAGRIAVRIDGQTKSVSSSWATVGLAHMRRWCPTPNQAHLSHLAPQMSYLMCLRWGRVRLSSGRPTGAERSGGAPWGQGTAGNPGKDFLRTGARMELLADNSRVYMTHIVEPKDVVLHRSLQGPHEMNFDFRNLRGSAVSGVAPSWSPPRGGIPPAVAQRRARATAR